jgi:hypothetical protein
MESTMIAGVEPWEDTDDAGTKWTRNNFLKLNTNSPISDEIKSLPFGYGASVYNLGQQESMSGMGKDAIAHMSRSMANALPSNCQRNTIVQLGENVHESTPMSELAASPSIVLTVWACDHGATKQLSDKINSSMELANERGEEFTLNDLVNLREYKVCFELSRDHRSSIAMGVCEAVGIQPPSTEMDSMSNTINDKANFETVRIRADADDNSMHVLMDANHPSSGAIIFHSPSRGHTIYESTDRLQHRRGTHQGIVGSDGRTQAYIQPGSEVGAHVASTMPTDSNHYAHAGLIENQYKEANPLSCLNLLSHCKATRVRAIATVMPNAVAMNGKLYGEHSIDNLSAMVGALHPDSQTVKVPNTPEWRQALCDADPSGLPYTFMNPDTSKLDENGKAMHFEIDKGSLTSALGI